MSGQQGPDVQVVRIDEAGWDVLANADGVLFGCPTHMGGPSWQFKRFADATNHKAWVSELWRDKLAGGYTNSAAMSGDKFSTLTYFWTLAMQHGMVWIGSGMTKTRINVQGLYAALDAERTTRGLSWRQLAKEIGVSPSLLSRLGNDLRPDADGFATLVRWLNMPAEEFMIDLDIAHGPQSEPDLVTQLAPLLRASRDLGKRDVAYLEEVIRATIRHAHASREEP